MSYIQNGVSSHTFSENETNKQNKENPSSKSLIYWFPNTSAAGIVAVVINNKTEHFICPT